jgi:PTH1 family peptidyl-tRNA hydrolase
VSHPAGEPFRVVGLGNPGSRYADTRHNIGFLVIDALAKEVRAEPVETPAPADVSRFTMEGSAGPREVHLVKPLTYMNRSGLALRALGMTPGAAPREDGTIVPPALLVIVDDLYLPFGRLRLRGDGSDGGHNGLKSVSAALGTTGYPRLRAGVGPQPEGVPSEEFVLERFPDGEAEALPEFLERAAACARAFLEEGLAPAMNRFNR